MRLKSRVHTLNHSFLRNIQLLWVLAIANCAYEQNLDNKLLVISTENVLVRKVGRNLEQDRFSEINKLCRSFQKEEAMDDLSCSHHNVDYFSEKQVILLCLRVEGCQELIVFQTGAFNDHVSDDRAHVEDESLWISFDINCQNASWDLALISDRVIHVIAVELRTVINVGVELSGVRNKVNLLILADVTSDFHA